MRSTVEPLEGNKVKVSVEVDEVEFDKAIDAAFRKIARQTRIPGFRPGKAPRRILEARLGADVAREEAIRDALPDYYIKALEEQDVDAIAAPEIEITSGQDSGPIQFEAVVEVRPEVSVAGYQGPLVTVPSPDVTDEWASDASEFETVDALRDDIRTRLGAVKKMQAQMSVRNEVADALVELVAEEIPEPLINEEMQRRLHELSHRLAAQGADLAQYLQATGRSAEEFQSDLHEAATSAVKADLALRSVADAEGLEATDEELDAEIERIAQAAGQKPAAVRKQLDRNDHLPAVRSDIRKGKALTWLTEHVEIADEEGKIIDRAELMNPTPDTTAEEEA